jgi:hypothetical protein
MPDLKTLQYPRWIHRGGDTQLVHTAETCDAAMDAGWVLSPGDEARTTVSVTITPIDEHADSEADAPPTVDAVPEPETLKKRKGKQRV